MREEKGRRWKEKENDSEGRSRRGRKGRRKGRYASELKPPNPKMLATSLSGGLITYFFFVISCSVCQLKITKKWLT